ncbi:MAG: hypothetical protein Q7S79_01575 [bacterium]|nr:hypothetical protein [bacterium]
MSTETIAPIFVPNFKETSFKEFHRLRPKREIYTEDGYRWAIFEEEKTGLTLVGLEDLETHITFWTPLANPNKRTAAYKAWGGARQSRAPGTPPEIYMEMGEKGVDPDKKVEQTFIGYGHKSVGDMARMMRDADGVPIHYPFAEFNDEYTNAGQEKSSRYIRKFRSMVLFEIKHFLQKDKISKEDLGEIEGRYQAIGKLSQELAQKHKSSLAKAFSEHFEPKNSRERDSLGSRVLDCTRFFTLLGQRTAMSNDNSAREWSRTISDLRASPIRFYQRMGEHLQRFFTPTRDEEDLLGFKAEAPSLIRHTEPTTTTNDNIKALHSYLEVETDLKDVVEIDYSEKVEAEGQGVELLDRKYTEGDKMVAQYVMTIWPGMKRQQVLDWVHSRPDEIKSKISSIIMNGHHCNNELSLLAITRGITLVHDCSIGEARDDNRHRGFGRFIPLPILFGEKLNLDTVAQILAKGFVLPAYLTHMPELRDIKTEFESDLKTLYEEIYGFIKFMHQTHDGVLEDYSFVLNLLPMAHKTELWMHGDPKQVFYMPDRRRRPGGHVNYILLAQEANKLVRESDPYLSGMKFPAPNPFSRDEFFNRS